MSLLKMKLIVYIDRYKQITAVANALELKQPTISFHMKKMEEEWGVKLFESRTGKVLLTPSGKMLLNYALQITALYDEAMTRLSVMHESKRKRFVIGCSNSAAAYMAYSSALRQLQPLREIANISVSVHEREELFDKLEQGTVDLVLCGEDRIHGDGGNYRHQAISSAALKLVGASTHPLMEAGGGVLSSDMLSDKAETVELIDVSVQQCIAQWSQSENHYFHTGISYGSVELILNHLADAESLALLPECLVPRDGRYAILPLWGDVPSWKLVASWSRHYWDQELIASITRLLSPDSAS
ncbi:LysR family transcriptional regulator [Paenibacillus sp. 1011MAR3C5]|uniref:LysR family transcriptional regulator n=1 Tax=Paenibacillus sp. 1011MAR3C5 TaxID=1675787 RepID=UPI000E6BE747|nr:LysR family transcriptional regulator [Paenibacillus sp. 1011MAR3C5]RJE84693.1 LysR family transcriptional regulator [Paenibacillus sp. 1011MAR3C5]